MNKLDVIITSMLFMFIGVTTFAQVAPNLKLDKKNLWSYGVKKGSTYTAFELSDKESQDGVMGYENGEGGMFQNITGQQLNVQGAVTLAKDEVMMTVFTEDAKSVMSYVAQKQESYKVTAIWSIAPKFSSNVDVQILKNGQPIFAKGITLEAKRAKYSEVLKLNEGDKLEFVLGSGNDGIKGDLGDGAKVNFRVKPGACIPRVIQNSANLEDGAIYQFEGVANYAGKFLTAKDNGVETPIAFAPVTDVKKTQFKVSNKCGIITFESVAYPGYYLYPIRPAGSPWVVGMKKGPTADDTDFQFRLEPNSIDGDKNHLSIVPIKNQAWVFGPGFPAGVGFHMPGAFGYTEEGRKKGSFNPIKQ